MSRWHSVRTGLGLAAAVALVVTGGTPVGAAPSSPVRPIVAPVLDIAFGEADVRQEARVEKGRNRTTITLDATVLFGRDSDVISTRARRRLDEVARRLRGEGPGRVSITGYTDDLGSAAYGRDLSRRRAAAVGRELRRTLPMSAYPFALAGRGEADPAASNTTEAGRRKNRRVVLVFDRR